MYDYIRLKQNTKKMAQHIKIQDLEHKKFRQIEEIIRREFKSHCGIITIQGSLKWQEIKHKDFKIDNNDLVFTKLITPPKSFCDCKCHVEVHYNKLKGEITEIFVVA